jgi:hypothetical protein
VAGRHRRRGMVVAGMTATLLIFCFLCLLAGIGGGWFLNEWVRAIDREIDWRRKRRPF